MQEYLPTLDPIYFHLIAFFVNFIILIILYIYSIKIYQTEKKLKHKETKLANETEKIIYDANKKASELISASKNISLDLEEQYKKSFDKTLASAQDEYVSFFAKLDQFHKEKLAEFLLELQAKNIRMTDEYDGIMKKAVFDNLDSIKARLDKTLEGAEAEIEAYKTKKFAEIEKDLADKLYQKIKLNLPKYLTPEQSMEIVSNSITKFIQENKNAF